MFGSETSKARRFCYAFFAVEVDGFHKLIYGICYIMFCQCAPLRYTKSFINSQYGDNNMSHVKVFHWLKPRSAPVEHQISNALSLMAPLARLLDPTQNVILRDYDTVYKPAYNRFQGRSDVPESQKIAVGFLTDRVLVLDGDRLAVSGALLQTFKYLNSQNGGNIHPTIQQLGRKIAELPPGPIIVTTSFVSDTFPYENQIDMKRFNVGLQKLRRSTRSDIEGLLDRCEKYVAIPLSRVLSESNDRRLIPLPRLWND